VIAFPKPRTPLVLATHNAGKLRELTPWVLSQGLEPHTLDEFGIPSPEETGSTLEANALIKAEQARKQCALAVLADDSGLEVDALEGGPGVMTADYAGPAAGAEDNIRKLLSALDGLPPNRRLARFRCVLVLWPAERESPFIAEGVCSGRILAAPRGQRGFGYDPVFEILELGRSMAEIEYDLKEKYSHRGLALAALHNLLATADWPPGDGAGC
jgi:XTP/dITP diphosphohydrolase